MRIRFLIKTLTRKTQWDKTLMKGKEYNVTDASKGDPLQMITLLR